MRKVKIKKPKLIGNTMDQEITFPPWPKYDIYADTETFVCLPESLKPWEHEVTSSEYTTILAQCVNVPWLLVWSFQPLTFRNNKNDGYQNGNWLIEYDFFLNNFKDFFDSLRTVYKLKKIPVIWFHNASFDLTAIVNMWKRFLDPDLVVYYYARETNKNFLRGAMYSPKFEFKAYLGDTMLFETISIETAGKSLGIPKGKDVPYTMANIKIDPPNIRYLDYKDGQYKSFNIHEYIEYACRDVEIQQQYAENLKAKKDLIYKTVIGEDTYQLVKRNLKGKTQGSLAKEIANVHLQQSGFPEGIDGHFRFEISDFELFKETVKSNMGGYTTSNKDVRYYSCAKTESGGSQKEILSVYDCNSEYPYVLTRSIPFGEILDTAPDNPNYTTWYVVSFKKCTWKPPMDCLKYSPISMEKINERLEERFFMLKEYYDMIDRLCDHESTIHEVKYQRNTDVFRPFINKLYTLRNEFKSKMKGLDKKDQQYTVYDHQQHGCKIIMNSIYGKLCETPHLNTCFYYSKTFTYTKFVNDNITYRSILAGSFITYTGRLLLIDKIEKCIRAGYTVLYSDTDSVMFAHPEDADVKSIFGEDTGQLGEWKCEGHFDLFLNSGVKKKYCLLDTQNPANYKIAWSGINKAVPNVFKKLLDKGDKQVIEDLKVIFSPDENIIFRKQKRSRVLSLQFHQKIIYDTDFQMNKGLGKVTGECEVNGDTYKLIRYEKQ